MSRIERARRLDANVEQFIKRQRSGGDPMLQRDAVEKLHGDKGLTALIVNLVNGANVRMIKRRGRFCFALETAKRLRIPRHIVRQELQRHKAAELDIFSLVNHTHTAATESFHDAVVRDGAADQRLRIRHVAHILGCEESQVNAEELRSLRAKSLSDMCRSAKSEKQIPRFVDKNFHFGMRDGKRRREIPP